VHPPANVDRIDLDVAEVGERGGDIGKWFVEAVHAPQKPAGGGGGDFKRGRHPAD